MVDARDGITAGDQIIAQALRKSGKPVILAANKCEGRVEPPAEAYGLGFGEPLAISAEHNLGMEDLVAALEPLAGPVAAPLDEEEEDDIEFSEDDEPEEEIVVNYLDRPLRLALVGRPNVGKSSLFNQLLGEERALVGPEAGLTRDAITAPWKAGERDVLLHGLYGLRKKARMAGETLEDVGRLHAWKQSASPIAWW